MEKEKTERNKVVAKEVVETKGGIVGIKKNISKLTLVVGIFVFVIILLLGILLFPYIETFGKETFSNLPFWSEDAEEEMETEENNTADLSDDTVTPLEEEEETTIITGEYTTATVPTGWTIVEYMDGDGSDMLVEGTTYTGLTGLKIFNPDDEAVFSMIAVSGIGFAGCRDYAIFADDNADYYQEQVDMNNEIGETMNEHDYTLTDYAEFEWMGTTMRRIDDLYYYDTKEGNNYFEPPCVPGLIILEGFTFQDTDYTYEAYFYGLEDIATEEEYEIVDSILESMETI